MRFRGRESQSIQISAGELSRIPQRSECCTAGHESAKSPGGDAPPLFDLADEVTELLIPPTIRAREQLAGAALETAELRGRVGWERAGRGYVQSREKHGAISVMLWLH